MKVLDVKNLDSGIRSIEKEIETIQAQISAIQRAVRGITELEAELKGKTGEAIRSFYQHVHQTFLIFLHQSLTDYTFILKEMKTSVSNFEGDNNGFIHEGFISEDVRSGIDRAEEMTYDLINIINEEMNSVSDIISLSPLNMNEFSQYADKGRERATKVIEALYELDYQQTKALEGVDKDLNLLQNYINEMNISFGNSSAIPNFTPLSAFGMPTYKKVKEKVFGKSISIQIKNLHQLKNMKYDLNTYKGIGLGIWDIVNDIAQGVHQLATDPIGVVTELGYMILHPVETGKYMTEAIISSFERDVINGDNESRARWATYAVGTVAETVLGTKGVLAGLRISRTGTKISKIKTKDVNNARQSNAFYYPENNLAFAGAYDTVPYNVYNLNKIKEQLLMKSTGIGENWSTKISVDDFNPKTATNKQKGNFGEIISSDNLLNNPSLKEAGYDLKPVGRDAPASIDDKIVRGIDGLYENTNPNSNIKYVIDEAKFGKGQLGKTKDGKQMSDDWLVGEKSGNDRIYNAVEDKELAIKIMRSLEKNEVERVLSKVDSNGNVKTYKLDKNGNTIGEWP